MQQFVQQWYRTGYKPSWSEVVAEAEKAKPFTAFIDLEQPEFYEAGNMIERVQAYCKRTGQTVPKTVGDLSRASTRV